VKKETEGRVKIKIYPANQLGDFVQVYEEVIRGSIDIAHITVPDTFDGRIGAGFLPYVAKDYKEMREVFAPDAYLPTQIGEINDNLGVKFLGYYAEGFAGIGSTKPLENVYEPGKEKGILLRCAPVDVFTAGAQSLGFRTITVPWADTFSAMQTGVADGTAGCPPNLHWQIFRDVIKYYYQYNQSHEITQYVMNKRTFEKLGEQDAKIVENAFAEACANSFDIAEQEDDLYRKKLAEHGIKVVVFSDEEMNKIASYVREKAWKRLEETMGKEFLDGLRASLAK
jgi:TRAP-type C4-dicarboxylate transport system substrate-binding protein